MTNVTSTRLSNMTAAQPIMNPKGNECSPVVVKDVVAVGTANLAANSYIYLCMLPLEAKVHDIKLLNDVLDSNGSPTLTVDVGVSVMDKNGNVATASKDAVYASNVTIGATVNTVSSNLAFSARNSSAIMSTVATDLGDAVVPNDGTKAILTVKVHTAAATAAAGNLGFVVSYTV